MITTSVRQCRIRKTSIDFPTEMQNQPQKNTFHSDNVPKSPSWLNWRFVSPVVWSGMVSMQNHVFKDASKIVFHVHFRRGFSRGYLFKNHSQPTVVDDNDNRYSILHRRQANHRTWPSKRFCTQFSSRVDIYRRGVSGSLNRYFAWHSGHQKYSSPEEINS